MNTTGPAPYVRVQLRNAKAGQVLLVAEISFTILAAHRQPPRLIRLDLAADDDGEPATLIGRPWARVVVSASPGPGRQTATTH